MTTLWTVPGSLGLAENVHPKTIWFVGIAYDPMAASRCAPAPGPKLLSVTKMIPDALGGLSTPPRIKAGPPAISARLTFAAESQTRGVSVSADDHDLLFLNRVLPGWRHGGAVVGERSFHTGANPAVDMTAIIAAPSPDENSFVSLICARLDEARRLALHGNAEQARQICADAVTGWLPCLSRDVELLRTVVVTLFCAGGFELLRRLLAATNGRRIRFVPISPDTPPPRPNGITTSHQRNGTITVTFIENLVDHPLRDCYLESWSRDLTTAPHRVVSLPGS